MRALRFPIPWLTLLLLAYASAAFAESQGSGGLWQTLTQIDAAKVKEIAATHMWLALLLCFGSGILTSFTPCVYPVIPITINIFGRAAQQDPSKSIGWFNFASFRLAIVYVGGMCVTYSTLGIVAGLTGSLFGKLLQSTFMLGFLAVLFGALALGQMGLFKMALPGSWQTKLATVGHTRSLFGIFMMGVVAGLIVSPCVGPIITGILTFVFESSNAFLGFTYFLSFSLGLGVLFLLIGGFSGVVAKLPRSGTWMVRVNYFLAGLLFLASGYYGLLLAKRVGLVEKSIPASGNSIVQWVNDEQQALAMAAEQSKPIIVDFTAEWCEACHEIEAQIFQNDQIAAQLKQFVTLRIDVTEENERNAKILEKYGVIGLPTIVFAKPDGQVLEKPRVHGLMPIHKFQAILESLF